MIVEEHIGKQAFLRSYGEDCASALRGSSARGFSAECDPFCSLQASRRPGVMSEIDIFCFLNGQLQHQHFGPYEEVGEQCFRWKHRTFRNKIDFADSEGLDRAPNQASEYALAG